MSQRNLDEKQLDYAIEHGKVYNRAGATWYVVRFKDIPREDRSNDEIRKMDGIVVCMEEGVIATVYRNDRPGHYVRQKPKYDRRSRRGFDEAAA